MSTGQRHDMDSGMLLSGLNLLTSTISQVGLVNLQNRFMH